MPNNFRPTKKQPKMKTLATFAIAFILSIVSAYSQDISGDWSGIAKRGDKEITFVFNIEQENSKYSTTMSVPTFRISGIKPSATTFTNGTLIIDGSNVGMSYEGIFNKETQQFEGSYKEGGIELVLNLKKGAVKTKDEAQTIVTAVVDAAQDAWDNNNVEGESSDDKIERLGSKPADITLEE